MFQQFQASPGRTIVSHVPIPASTLGNCSMFLFIKHAKHVLSKPCSFQAKMKAFHPQGWPAPNRFIPSSIFISLFLKGHISAHGIIFSPRDHSHLQSWTQRQERILSPWTTGPGMRLRILQAFSGIRWPGGKKCLQIPGWKIGLHFGHRTQIQWLWLISHRGYSHLASPDG